MNKQQPKTKQTSEPDISISFHDMKTFLQLNPEDEAILRELEPLVRQHADDIVERFYQTVQLYPELIKLIETSGSSVARLKQVQHQYLLTLFQGTYNEEYASNRARIGEVHRKINLGTSWYLGCYRIYSTELSRLVVNQYRFRPQKIMHALQAVQKVLFFDVQIIIKTYIASLSGELHHAHQGLEVSVEKYNEYIDEVSSGNLKNKINIEDTNSQAMVDLGNKLNNMTKNLADIAEHTKSASCELSQTVQSVQNALNIQSTGASQQAAAVSETTSTLAEIKATSTQTLEKAQGLGRIAQRTREESEQGIRSVDESIQGIEAIRERVEGIAHTILALSEQTQQIGEITDVVTGLAQQLKMLALNASIEAAKAGEAGKGFGVVAAEVKELAEQSQQSTAQVQKILQDIRHATDRAVMATEEGGKGVDAGVELVGKTGESMRNLSTVINEASTASQQIVAAIRQEVTGIDQVTTAMNEINQVTSQFVNSSEQTKQAAQQLIQLSQKLNSSVSRFKL